MRPDTMRTLADCIHEWRRRDRDYNGTDGQPSFDTTTENDAEWDQRNRSGDGRCSQDNQG